MKNFLTTFICTMMTITCTLSQTETLIAYDYIENYDWFGSWWIPSPTTGYFNNLSVSPTNSAVIYGTGKGSSTIEQDWYVLPSIPVDPTKDHIFKMRLAAQTMSNPTATPAGLDGGDYITVQLSKDGGGYVSELRVSGFSNATWDYSSTAMASKVSNGTLTIFTPSGGGDRTNLGDGYSYIELFIPAGPSSIAIDIYCRVNGGGEDWWMDNFELYEIGFITLPVELLYFEGYEKNDDNFLYWSTASENNSNYYDIQWSVDTYLWKSIGNIPAAGNSTSDIHYSFKHRDYTDGFNYYKLVQYDYDGWFEEFDIIAIDNRQTNQRIIKYVDFSGREINPIQTKGLVIGIYEDGSSIQIYLK